MILCSQGKDGERQLWKAGIERLESVLAECGGLYRSISLTKHKRSVVLVELELKVHTLMTIEN